MTTVQKTRYLDMMQKDKGDTVTFALLARLQRPRRPAEPHRHRQVVLPQPHSTYRVTYS